MAVEALGVYLSGAVAPGRTQRDDAASLGGFRSSVRCGGLVADRPAALPGVAVRYVSGSNGVGSGTLSAVGVSALAWRPPGATVAGASVTVAPGERKVLAGAVGEDGADGWIEVERTGTADLAGEEVMGLRETYNNVLGGSHVFVADATAGVVRYRAVHLFNDLTGDITDGVAWLDADCFSGVAFASEALDVDGSVQAIADEETAPSGLTFVSPTSHGAGLSLGTLAAGAGIGLWIERTVGPAATASALERVAIRIRYTHDGEIFEAVLPGLFAVEGAGQYELYAEMGAAPDPETDTLRAYGASSPLEWTSALAEGTWYPVVYYRNAFGLLGAAHAMQPLVIDGSGDSLGSPPAAPALVTLEAIAGGKVDLTATYHGVMEPSAAARADYWRVWVNFDGSTPDPDADDPFVEVAMGSARRALLRWTSDALVDNTDVVAIVRTVRAFGEATEVESVDSATVSATASLVGPPRVRAVAMRGRGHGLTFPPAVGPDGTVEYVDAGNNIFFQFYPGRTEFWADTVLIWVLVYDGAATGQCWVYIPSEWDTATDTVAAAGSSDAIEVASWTGGDKRIYVNVNGSRRVEIDVTNLVITAESWNAIGGLPVVVPTAGAWLRYADTLLPVWDVDREDWRPVVKVDLTGIHFEVAVDATLDQATLSS